MSLHPQLADRIAAHYAEALQEPPRTAQDAVLLVFTNGLAVELRMANAEEYAMRWRWGDAELCIDTAPLYRDLPTYPHHLHDLEGAVRPDPLTTPGADPWQNVQAVLDAILQDPLLET
jgi:hypothetical protein